MKKLLVVLSLSIITFFTFGNVFCAKPVESKVGACPHCSCATKLNLNAAMRGLWAEHVMYTRNYIISNLASLEDIDAITKRLLRNQDDIGNAIKSYYGADAGKKLTALLRDHILIAAKVVDAAKSGNKDTLNVAQKEWYGNADSIAAFLSSANPHWKKDELTNMLYTHLKLTTKEVVARLQKDWKADVSAYDKGYMHMMMFADVLTQGIEKQFPDKFKQ